MLKSVIISKGWILMCTISVLNPHLACITRLWEWPIVNNVPVERFPHVLLRCKSHIRGVYKWNPQSHPLPDDNRMKWISLLNLMLHLRRNSVLITCAWLPERYQCECSIYCVCLQEQDRLMRSDALCPYHNRGHGFSWHVHLSCFCDWHADCLFVPIGRVTVVLIY